MIKVKLMARQNSSFFENEAWWNDQLQDESTIPIKHKKFYEPVYKYGSCNHWQQRVKVGRRELTCSSIIGKPSKMGAPYPDFGVYLDKSWSPVVVTNGCRINALANRVKYKAMFVDWHDFDTLPKEHLDLVVEVIVSKIRHGKWVDIACNHGHGRTGTLLACIFARMEHIGAKEAIEAVHQRYCSHAIENHFQHDSVYQYVERINKRKGER
jgi:hypothetical protein